MTTSLDAYRSDREALLARVRELEAEVESLTGKSETFEWQRACPRCGTRRLHGKQVEINDWENVVCFDLGVTPPKHCKGFWRRLGCWLAHAWGFGSPRGKLPYDRWRKPHFHQRCTACGARWVVDAEGWRFD